MKIKLPETRKPAKQLDRCGLQIKPYIHERLRDFADSRNLPLGKLTEAILIAGLDQLDKEDQK